MARERIYASKDVEREFKRRSPGGFWGNQRFWDMFNRYTSKTYAHDLNRQRENLFKLQNRLERVGEKHPDVKHELIEEFEEAARDYINTHTEMYNFHVKWENELQTLHERVNDKREIERKILSELGRGSIGKKDEISCE